MEKKDQSMAKVFAEHERMLKHYAEVVQKAEKEYHDASNMVKASSLQGACKNAQRALREAGARLSVVRPMLYELQIQDHEYLFVCEHGSKPAWMPSW